jgi:hypothetical protein
MDKTIQLRLTRNDSHLINTIKSLPQDAEVDKSKLLKQHHSL